MWVFARYKKHTSCCAVLPENCHSCILWKVESLTMKTVIAFSRLLSVFTRLVPSRGWNKRMITQKNCGSSARDKLLRLGQFWALRNHIVKKAACDQVPSAENNWAITVSPPKNHSFNLELDAKNSTYIYRGYLSIKMQSSVSIFSIMIKVKKCEKVICGYAKPLWTTWGLDKAVKDKKLQFIRSQVY